MRADPARPCVIFDCHHPKHFLAIRRVGDLCRAQGIEPIWTIQDKDVLAALIREHGYEPRILATAQKTLVQKLLELAVYDTRLASLAWSRQPLALIGKTISLAHVGWLLGIPSILINDDSAKANPQFRYLGYPLASRILTASCLAEDYGPRQRNYEGLMELAYLHPNAFTPDPAIRDELGVGPEERIFVIRLAAFDAYHDVGCKGLSHAMLQTFLERLAPLGRSFIVAEQELTGSLAQYRLPVAASRLHHVLAASDLVVGDGLTVCVEAALLGVPAIAVGSYIGKHAYSNMIEKRFGLMYGFTPDRHVGLLACFESLLSRPDVKAEWQGKREAMLRAWGDPTEVYWEELCAAMAPRLERQPAPNLPAI